MPRTGAPWKYGEPTDWVSMRLPRWLYQLAKSIGKRHNESAPTVVVAQMERLRSAASPSSACPHCFDPIAEKRAAELQIQVYKADRRIDAETRLTAAWAKKATAKAEQVDRLQRRLRQRAFILKRLLKLAGAADALKHLDLADLEATLQEDLRAEAADVARKYREATRRP